MGFFDAILGNASEIDATKAQQELARVFNEGETVQVAFQVFRDSYLFTNRRLVLVDRQGMTGNKIELHSIPYRAITQFSIETAGGLFDSDADLKIWISGQVAPITRKVSKKVDVMRLQQVIAWYVCGNK